MSNRGMIKWQPFNAVAVGDKMIDDVLRRKNKIVKPILSDDQIIELETKIMESLHNKTKIKLKIFSNGKLYLKEGYIENIDIISKNIVFNDNKKVFFSQIIDFY